MELVSCILPVNRDDGFLQEAVESILGQTYRNLELIIVANNCTEKLWESITAFNDERVRPFRREIGQLPYALNFAIEQSKGKYIARMDADDVADPERFERQVNFLQQHPDCHVLGSDFSAINEKGAAVRFERKLYVDDESIKQKLPISNPMYHPTIMMHRSFIIEVRGYNYDFYAEDYELWLRARRLGKYGFHNLPEKLLKYRIHSAQATSSKNKRAPFISEMALRYREFLYSGDLKFLIGMFAASRVGQKLIGLNSRRKGNIKQ